jgi:hypothetical protein
VLSLCWFRVLQSIPTVLMKTLHGPFVTYPKPISAAKMKTSSSTNSPAVLNEHVQKRAYVMNCQGSCQKPACWALILFCLFAIPTIAVAQISLSSSNVNFGNVQVGSTAIQPVAVTNNGKATVTLTQVAVSGTGFGFAGPNLPLTLGPQQTATLAVSLSPQGAGSFGGSLTGSGWSAWGGHGTVHYGGITVALSGTGYSTTPGFLTAPSSLSLGNVPIGSSQTQILTLSNSGGSSLTVSGVTVSSSAFTVGGLSFPYILAPGSSTNLSVVFAPTTVGNYSSTASLSSTASDPSVSVSLSGSATSSNGTLNVTPGSMSFGSVQIGASQTLSGSVTASGGNVSLSSASSNNSEFTLGGFTLPTTLGSGQSVPFTVTFAPTAAGTASANISFFTSNSTSASETASGSGANIQHSVDLSWNASTSTSIAGYNVYRGTTTSGPFSRVNSALDVSMSYIDGTVQSGQTYYYVTTAVDALGVESPYSNTVQVVVPTP